MRTLSADWMANTSKPESETHSLQHGGEESRANLFHPRPVAPTAAQVLVFYIFLGPCFRKCISVHFELENFAQLNMINCNSGAISYNLRHHILIVNVTLVS